MFNIAFKTSSLLLIVTTTLLSSGSALHAEKKEVRVAAGLTAGQFVRNCESMGGEIDESTQSPDGVSCGLPSGTTVDCAFGPKDAYCEVSTPGQTVPSRQVKGLIGPPTIQGGVLK